MVEIKCKECECRFRVTFKYRKTKFCSKKCYSLSRITLIKCRMCENTFKSSLNRYTCSEECSNKLKKVSNKLAAEKRRVKAQDRELRPVWNKGLTKETDERLKKSSETAKRRNIENPARVLKRKHSAETIVKLKINAGGVRRGSGRGKSGWYKGYWCDSTYELVWIIYQLDNGKHPVRNTLAYFYQWDGKLRRYYPDFVLDGVVYEIKGYETPRDLEKYRSVMDKTLIVLLRTDLQSEFLHVQGNYEYSTLSDLYDESKYKNQDVALNPKRRCACGKSKSKQSIKCKSCFRRTSKLDYLDLEDFNILLSRYNCKQLGILLGVSDTAIRKYIKKLRSRSSDVEHSVEAGSVADSSPAVTI